MSTTTADKVTSRKSTQGKPKATLPTPTQAPDEVKAQREADKAAAKAERERIREEAKQKAIAHEEEVSREQAAKMSRLFDDTKSTFDRAKAAYVAVQKGASIPLVAQELSMLRAKVAYPEATEVELEYYASNPSGKGGTQISKASLHAYASAWSSVVDGANLAADAELVGLAFRLYSKGGTANSRKEAEVRASALVAEGKVDQARKLYIEAARLNLRGVDMFGIKVPEKKSAPETDAAEAEVEVVTTSNKLTLAIILGQIEAWKNAPLTDKELDRVLDAVADFATQVHATREAEANA